MNIEWKSDGNKVALTEYQGRPVGDCLILEGLTHHEAKQIILTLGREILTHEMDHLAELTDELGVHASMDLNSDPVIAEDE